MLFFLFRIIQGDVATLACPYPYGVFHRNDEYPTVSNLASASRLANSCNGLLHILVAHDNIEQNSLYGTCVVHHATVYPRLAHLSLTSHIVVT